MLQLLVDNPILLLTVVSALGYLLGQIQIKGSSLGVAAILFAGLAIGALDSRLKLPEFMTFFGLILFVYAIGLSSGPGFFASFKRKGLRDNALVVAVLTLAAGLAVGAHYLLRLGSAVTAGLYAGSLTNTPALASLFEKVRASAPPEVVDQMLDEPVIGYSIAYPMGVVGMVLALFIWRRFCTVNRAGDDQELQALGASGEKLESHSIRVMNPEATRETVQEMSDARGWDVVFGRLQRGVASQVLIGPETRLQIGDVVSVVGTDHEAARVAGFLGKATEVHLEADRRALDFRRIFVSRPEVAGRPLRDLDFLTRHGAIVTRVRRGDVEWLVHDDTVLELGDRVRVVARPDQMQAVSGFFGDSYRALSEINLLTFSLGLTMGLLLGMIPIGLPGGVSLKLGLAGGPLVAGLLLGKLGRTGPLVWYLPYSSNLLLRQLGLVLFFAGVGTRAGHAFFSTLTQSGGAAIFLAGTVITCATALGMLWVGSKLFRIPIDLLSGMLAGLQTQPAVLSYALQQSRNELPNIGYAMVFPIATITKIVLAQLLLSLLSGS